MSPTNHLLVLLNNCLRLGAQEEVKIQDPHNSPVGEAHGGQNNVHSITVPQVHTMREGGGGGGGGGRTHLMVAGVRAIWRDTSRWVEAGKMDGHWRRKEWSHTTHRGWGQQVLPSQC